MGNGITLQQALDAMEVVWKDNPYREELFSDDVLHIYVKGVPWDLYINKDVWYEIQRETTVSDTNKSCKNKEDDR